MNEPARNPSRGIASHPRSDPSIRRRARDLAQLAPSQKKTAEAAGRTTTAEKAGGEGAIGVRSGGGRRKFIRPSSLSLLSSRQLSSSRAAREGGPTLRMNFATCSSFGSF